MDPLPEITVNVAKLQREIERLAHAGRQTFDADYLAELVEIRGATVKQEERIRASLRNTLEIELGEE